MKQADVSSLRMLRQSRDRIDRDYAEASLPEKLGFTLTNDLQLDGGMRWLTVRPPGSDTQELVLLDPMHSMLDEETCSSLWNPLSAPTGPRRSCATNWFSFTQRRF